MTKPQNDQTKCGDSIPLLSAEEMAKKLNISGRCVLNWFYGKIIPAAVHQGKVIRFREADVMAALERARLERETVSEGIPDHIVRFALTLAAPDVAEHPAWLLTREPTQDEEATASKFAIAYFDGIRDLKDGESRRAFVNGVIHANHLLSLPD